MSTPSSTHFVYVCAGRMIPHFTAAASALFKRTVPPDCGSGAVKPPAAGGTRAASVFGSVRSSAPAIPPLASSSGASQLVTAARAASGLGPPRAGGGAAGGGGACGAGASPQSAPENPLASPASKSLTLT